MIKLKIYKSWYGVIGINGKEDLLWNYNQIRRLIINNGVVIYN